MKVWITVKHEDGITSYEMTPFKMAKDGAFSRIIGDARPGAIIRQYEIDLDNFTVITEQTAVRGNAG